MLVRFNFLKLTCRQSIELIEFSPQVNFFHGQISAGKSTIARLIDFCLGADLERTTAVSQEVVSVELSAQINEYDVLLEREAKGSNQIQITWRNSKGEMATVLAPVTTTPEQDPIWGKDIYNVSDMLFFLLNTNRIMVRRSKKDADSPLIRLSFRDLMWYCYLEQLHLDSSFYCLTEPFKEAKSRDVMRFVVGFHSEHLNQLEIELAETVEERNAKIQAAKKVKDFLEKLGYDSEEVIAAEITSLKDGLKSIQQEKANMAKDYQLKTHFADELRAKLRSLSNSLAMENQAAIDIKERIDEQKSLRNELLNSKFKLARAKSSVAVLSKVTFDYCPSCGSHVVPKENSDSCILCCQPPSDDDKNSIYMDVANRDLTSQIDEITESINRHNAALRKQRKAIQTFSEEKAVKDRQLQEEMANYDSDFLARSRSIEQAIARSEQRILNLEKNIQLPKAVTSLEDEAEILKANESILRRRIKELKTSLTSANQYISEIEDAYLEALLAVGVPGLTNTDRVWINRNSWIPYILTNGDEALKWSFFNAGSGGKKTLLNVCYALAVHKVAALNDLPLPGFLIIDTPMKNISHDVNKDVFANFYRYLYSLAAGPLAETQFIIIDNEFIPPIDGMHIMLRERFLTPDDDSNPPLISYYRGP